MESKRPKRFILPKWAKWLIGVAVSLMVISIGASWYLVRHYKPILQRKITEKVHQASKGLYRIAIADLDIGLLSGSATVTGLRLHADSSVYARLRKQQQAPAHRISAFTNQLEIRNLNLWEWLLFDKVSIGTLHIDSLSLSLVKGTGSPIDDKAPKDLYRSIQEKIKALRVGEIVLRAIDMDMSDTTARQPLSLRRMHVRISDFLLDPDSFADTTRVYYSKRIEMELPEFDYALPGSVYRLACDRLRLDSESKSVQLHKLRLEPRIPKEQYFRNDKQNKALIALNWDTVRMEGWDMNRLIKGNVLYSRRLFLNNGAAVFRKDRRYQKDNVNKIGQAPHQQIMKLQQLIQVDTVWVKETMVQYRQINEKGTDEGIISFLQAQGHISNLTNDTARLNKDKYMRADLRASLMGKGLLHARFGFDMLAKDGAHSYSGSLGPMAAPAFNSILTPLLNLEIASGDIRRIRFDMQGNDYRNWGELRFDYTDFKVHVLSGLDQGERKKKGIVSFFVNKFVINDSNPDANEVYHVGDVRHTRVPEYSHFKTIWKSLQDGIAQCAGIGSDWLREKI